MYENDELLYTQEDMDEWMRTCENLQEHIKEQEEDLKLKDAIIKDLQEDNRELRKGINKEALNYFLEKTQNTAEKKLDDFTNKLLQMVTNRAELIDFGGYSEFMFTLYDLEMCIKELKENKDDRK